MSKRRGTFIVIDGVDGAGKGVQTALLRDFLVQRGYVVHVTSEPSDWPIGVLIRKYLRGDVTEGLPGWGSMALLFAADRMQHVEHEILPRIARGEIVLSDRYDASSIAYQSASAPDELREDDRLVNWIADINRLAVRPDLTIILELSEEAAAARREARGEKPELYETDELQRRLREQYRKLPTVRPADLIVFVDAAPSIKDVHQAILHHVGNVLPPRST